MTTGKTLIKAVREDIQKYPNISSMLLDLYDEKDHITTDKEVDFAWDLFVNNPNERTRFIEYLNTLEKDKPRCIGVKITEFHVILHYPTPSAKIFTRKNFINPLDYMD